MKILNIYCFFLLLITHHTFSTVVQKVVESIPGIELVRAVNKKCTRAQAKRFTTQIAADCTLFKQLVIKGDKKSRLAFFQAFIPRLIPIAVAYHCVGNNDHTNWFYMQSYEKFKYEGEFVTKNASLEIRQSYNPYYKFMLSLKQYLASFIHDGISTTDEDNVKHSTLGACKLLIANGYGLTDAIINNFFVNYCDSLSQVWIDPVYETQEQRDAQGLAKRCAYIISKGYLVAWPLSKALFRICLNMYNKKKATS